MEISLQMEHLINKKFYTRVMPLLAISLLISF